MIVVLFVIALFGGAIGKAIPGNADTERTPFSLEEILRMGYSGFGYSWISANEIIYKNATTQDLMVYDFKESKVLVDGSVLKKYNAVNYALSTDRKYLLLGHSEKKIFRHSSTEKYVVYCLADKSYTEIANNADLMLAKWAPNTDRVIYVKDNNIYAMEVTKKEVNRITTTGVPGVIFNGVSDWVYEARGNDFPEEILGTGDSISTSPYGDQMVYLTVDDSNVTEAVFMKYGKPGDLRNQYAEEIRLRYPKAGTTVPTYTMYHYNFTSKVRKVVSVYRTGREMVYKMSWVTNRLFGVAYANRAQNVTEIELCDLVASKCKKVTEDRNPKGWSVLALPHFSKEGERYLMRKRQPVGGVDYYHVHLINTDGSGGIALTNGTFMVTAISDWDEANKVVYYSASEIGKPSTSHIYAVSESGKGSPICITCQMSAPDGIPCKSGIIEFGKDFKNVVGRCLGPSTPYTAAYTLSADQKLTLMRYLNKNCDMRKYMRTKLEPKVLNLQVTVAKNMEADVRLYLPPNLDESGKTKYPMIIYVYGGPDNQQVTDKFRFDWSLYLTTNRSIIYGIIDGRGTGKKGTDMMYAVYRSFGTVEIQDQITAVKYLHGKFDFIDKNRTGIWGWSYGGYATTKVLENDVDGVFKCGVAGAPVTDWIYYNNIYTERYMDMPLANPKAYRESSTLYNVENLRKKQYLLIHGTGDDNVHYQHAMALVKVLQSKNIMFQQAAYPDEDHGFMGTSRRHMMYTMDKFFEKCFGLKY